MKKQDFRDFLRLRYSMLCMTYLTSTGPCGSPLNVNHALSRKKGGFIVQTHDNERDFLTTLLCNYYALLCIMCGKMFKQSLSLFHPMMTVQFNLKPITTNQDAHLNIKARPGTIQATGSYSIPGFEVRVSHVNSTCNQNKTILMIFKEQVQGKK